MKQQRSSRRAHQSPRLKIRLGALLLLVVGVSLYTLFLLWPQPESTLIPVPEDAAESPAAMQSLTEDSPDEPEHVTELITVHVVGAVKKPGLVQLEPGQRVGDAVEGAGNFTDKAASDAVNLAEPLSDGTQIRIPTREEQEQNPSDTPLIQSSTSNAAAAQDAAGSKVNINTADEAALTTLHGVGPATAATIIAHREQHGAFETAEDLISVKGIGPATLEKLRDSITVN